MNLYQWCIMTARRVGHLPDVVIAGWPQSSFWTTHAGSRGERSDAGSSYE